MTYSRDTPRTDPGHRYDRDPSETASEAVVFALSEATGRSPLELDPLADEVDPDALDELLTPGHGQRPAVTIRFEYCGWLITATPDEVRVTRQE